MNVRLPFGTDSLPLDIPDNWINGRCYRSHPFEPVADQAAVISQAFLEAARSDVLDRRLHGRTDAIIVLDPHYAHFYDGFLPDFLDVFEKVTEISPQFITLLVANSIWNPIDAASVKQLLPAGLSKRYPVILHDPFSTTHSRDVGKVMKDIPLHLNGLFLEADLKVLCGPVYPDLIHGFNGGRSLVLPGLAHESTWRELYTYERVNNPTVGYGQLMNNPFHIAAVQAQASARADMVVAPLLTSDQKLADLYIGEPGPTFLAAAEAATEKMRVVVKEPMDIAVTSGGGGPWDRSLIQVINAIAAMEPALKADGTILVLAEMVDGFGDDVLREILLGCRSPKDFERRHANGGHFVPGQWVAQRFYRVLRDREVLVHTSGLSADEVWAAGMTPVPDAQEAIEIAMQGHGQRCKICAVPDGPFALPILMTKK